MASKSSIFAIYKKCPDISYGAKHSFQFFEYGQSVAAKVWAAVFALITISLYKDREKENEENKAKKQETD